MKINTTFWLAKIKLHVDKLFVGRAKKWNDVFQETKKKKLYPCSFNILTLKQSKKKPSMNYLPQDSSCFSALQTFL